MSRKKKNKPKISPATPAPEDTAVDTVEKVAPVEPEAPAAAEPEAEAPAAVKAPKAGTWVRYVAPARRRATRKGAR